MRRLLLVANSRSACLALFGRRMFTWEAY